MNIMKERMGIMGQKDNKIIVDISNNQVVTLLYSIAECISVTWRCAA